MRCNILRIFLRIILLLNGIMSMRNGGEHVSSASALTVLKAAHYSTSNKLITSIQLSNSAAGADQSLMEMMFSACCRSL